MLLFYNYKEEYLVYFILMTSLKVVIDSTFERIYICINRFYHFAYVYMVVSDVKF